MVQLKEIKASLWITNRIKYAFNAATLYKSVDTSVCFTGIALAYKKSNI